MLKGFPKVLKVQMLPLVLEIVALNLGCNILCHHLYGHCNKAN
jgi:hypothetical protein